MKLITNSKKAILYLKKYGLSNFLKKFFRILYLQLFPVKLSELSFMDNILERRNIGKSDNQFQSDNLSIYVDPINKIRVNLVLDKLTLSNLLVNVVEVLIHLSVVLKSEIRIITRFEFPNKNIISSIINKKNISTPNIDFLFAQAGNPQISIPIRLNEFFIFTSWKNIIIFRHLVGEKRIIYVVSNEEAIYLLSEGNDFRNNLFSKNSEYLVVFFEKETYELLFPKFINNDLSKILLLEINQKTQDLYSTLDNLIKSISNERISTI
jgi:hypothetical protein